MPAIITRGAFSAKGFGFGASAGLNPCDGTKAIFQLGYNGSSNTTTRNKYTYASCTSTACGVGAASSCTFGGVGAGNSTRGIFGLGASGTTLNKYTYSTCSSTASGLPTTVTQCAGEAAGNNTKGIFGFGHLSKTRYKFTYACCSIASTGAGGNASACIIRGYGAGNSTRAIFSNGRCFPSIRDKFTYATCTSTTCGVAASSAGTAGGAAAGTGTIGIFQLGATTGNTATNVRNKYTYASCTSTACGVGAASANNLNSGAAAGNSTRGIFALGSLSGYSGTTIRNKYTYATCSSTACGVGAASANSAAGAATSWAVCVNV
jgi:hypothetical protein